VVDTDEPFAERQARFYRELRAGVAMDLLVYTPEEFARVGDRPFVKRILEEGRVLHAT